MGKEKLSREMEYRPKRASEMTGEIAGKNSGFLVNVQGMDLGRRVTNPGGIRGKSNVR